MKRPTSGAHRRVTGQETPWRRGSAECCSVLAFDQRVAKIILDYAQASFERSLVLRQLVAGGTEAE
jgi:hypothetical protein